MVDTSERAELQNCIRQAQDQLMELGSRLEQIADPQAKNLEQMVTKAGRLLR